MATKKPDPLWNPVLGKVHHVFLEFISGKYSDAIV